MLLTSAAQLTGQVLINPDIQPIEEALLIFLNEFLDHYTNDPEESDIDLNNLPVKLCVLSTPGNRGEQKLGASEVKL